MTHSGQGRIWEANTAHAKHQKTGPFIFFNERWHKKQNHFYKWESHAYVGEREKNSSSPCLDNKKNMVLASTANSYQWSFEVLWCINPRENSIELIDLKKVSYQFYETTDEASLCHTFTGHRDLSWLWMSIFLFLHVRLKINHDEISFCLIDFFAINFEKWNYLMINHAGCNRREKKSSFW